MSAVLEQQAVAMGANLCDTGVTFRVWAPNADSVSVVGDFNDWSPEANPLERDESGNWYAIVDGARAGDEYKYHITNGDKAFDRIDPYARVVTNSIGNAIVHDPAFDWGADDFQMPNHNELVIYELHIGTFNRDNPDEPGDFADAICKFDHLKKLGINAIEIMPVAEFAGDLSWGYNPAHIFAIEESYGGPAGLKRFIKKAHAAGFAVIMDVVYNHLGPSDLDVWQFDGWNENDKGGIYFYNDWRSTTPWGETRPDYGRPEVRQFLYDNAKMWLEEYRVDGLRYDMTAYIRKVNGIDASDIPEGWTLMQWINRDLASMFPGTLLVAEDLQGDSYLTCHADDGGAGFSTQWDAHFVHPIRNVIEQPEDAFRSMWEVCEAISFRYNNDAFQRVIYSESHDEVANGSSRVAEEVAPGAADNYFGQKLSVLAAGIALTAPGIPMLLQGQEFVEDRWFDDTDPLDWDRAKRFSGITRLFSDLISLRLNRSEVSRGLTGQHVNVHHVNDGDKVVAFHRWSEGGPADDVIVLANFSNRSFENYEIGFPSSGEWKARFNSDWEGYSEDFTDRPVADVEATSAERDGCPASGALEFGPYSIVVLSQEPIKPCPDDQESDAIPAVVTRTSRAG